MTPHPTMFKTYKPMSRKDKVQTADGSLCPITRVGNIEVSILRFTIRILRFDTIQMDKDTNLYFVSLERRILRIMSVSFFISIRYVSQRYNNFKIRIFFFQLYLFYSTSRILLGDQKTLVWEKKGKKRKNDKEREKYTSDWERIVKNSKHETVQVGNSFLFHLFYSLM
jgi:hypothetical protein